MNPNNPTPEKLTSYGFKLDEGSTVVYRRYDGKALWVIIIYDTGFSLTISEGYPQVHAMRFAPWAPRFFDDLMLSIGL